MGVQGWVKLGATLSPIKTLKRWPHHESQICEQIQGRMLQAQRAISAKALGPQQAYCVLGNEEQVSRTRERREPFMDADRGQVKWRLGPHHIQNNYLPIPGVPCTREPLTYYPFHRTK